MFRRGQSCCIPACDRPDDLKGYAAATIKQIYNNVSDLFVAMDSDRAQFIIIDSICVVGVDKED